MDNSGSKDVAVAYVRVTRELLEASVEIERLNTHLDGQVRYYNEQRQKDLAEIERLRDEVAEWRQAAQVEAGLRQEFLAKAERLEAALESERNSQPNNRPTDSQ